MPPILIVAISFIIVILAIYALFYKMYESLRLRMQAMYELQLEDLRQQQKIINSDEELLKTLTTDNVDRVVQVPLKLILEVMERKGLPKPPPKKKRVLSQTERFEQGKVRSVVERDISQDGAAIADSLIED